MKKLLCKARKVDLSFMSRRREGITINRFIIESTTYPLTLDKFEIGMIIESILLLPKVHIHRAHIGLFSGDQQGYYVLLSH